MGYENAALESAIREAENGLDQIVAVAERFVEENIFGGGIFGTGGWNDACGEKIGEQLISAVRQAVAQWMNIYDCKSELDQIKDDFQPLIAIIDDVKKELQ